MLFRFCDKNPALLFSVTEEDTIDYFKITQPPSPKTSHPSPRREARQAARDGGRGIGDGGDGGRGGRGTGGDGGRGGAVEGFSHIILERAPQPVLFVDILDELVLLADTKQQVSF